MLEKYDTNTLKCYIDVALPVYADMKIHTEPVLTMVKGSIISSSNKQNVN